MDPNVHYSTIYNNQEMEATLMSINRGTDKEAVVHIYNGILLSHKKDHIWVSSSEVNEPRDYYTQWSKSERVKQVLYINEHAWNLEKNGANETICRAGVEMQTQRTFWTQWGKERVEWVENVVLKHIYYHMQNI